MNYLAHLYLADSSDDCQLGTLMGDFIKGPLSKELPPGVYRGLHQHRQLDRFAQTHPAFRRSKSRLATELGHYKGILIDIFYDHFLARHWEFYSSQPLEDFAQQTYVLLERHFCRLPPGLQRVVPHMIRDNWLVSYRQKSVIGQVLERLSARLRRPNPLAAGLPELEKNYAGLEGDCRKFLREAAAQIRPLQT